MAPILAPSAALADGPRADLVIERWNTPTGVYAGEELDVAVRLTNVGEGASPAFASELRLEPLAPGAPAIAAVRWTNPGLRPGQAADRRVSLAIPATTPAGEYAVRVEIDVGGAVVEENEHNNLAERRMVVTPRPRPAMSPWRLPAAAGSAPVVP